MLVSYFPHNLLVRLFVKTELEVFGLCFFFLFFVVFFFFLFLFFFFDLA